MTYRTEIFQHAECDANCDDPECPYTHTPIMLRDAYAILAAKNECLKEELSGARANIGMLNVKDAAHIAARHDMRDEIDRLKADLAAAIEGKAHANELRAVAEEVVTKVMKDLAAAEQARAVAEGNLKLLSMSNFGLRQLIGEMVSAGRSDYHA